MHAIILYTQSDHNIDAKQGCSTFSTFISCDFISETFVMYKINILFGALKVAFLILKSCNILNNVCDVTVLYKFVIGRCNTNFVTLSQKPFSKNVCYILINLSSKCFELIKFMDSVKPACY